MIPAKPDAGKRLVCPEPFLWKDPKTLQSIRRKKR